MLYKAGMTDPYFTESITAALAKDIFVRLTLANYTGVEPDLKKVTARRITIKRENKLSFTYSYKIRDIVKNYAIEDGIAKISGYLQSGFGTATLLTTEFDLTYPDMKKSKPAEKEVPPTGHDRSKKRHVETVGKQYLQDLKITDAHGAVFKNAQDKYKQIDKYVEILAGLVKNIAPEKIKTITDMGAGKGYLTFALYDYLKNTAGMDIAVTGVEFRKDLVDLCNRISKQSAFDGLTFVQGTIENYDATGTDILIALHACDTATDDAIAKGIEAGAALIVVAPCCHKQIRNEIESGKKSNELNFLTQHGTFLERQAEMVTDGLRAMMFEYCGYTTKVFEFISDTHTPKNVMIVGTKTKRAKDPAMLEKIQKTKDYFGIRQHALEKKLGL